jgi:mannose-1-phosphate guanylyltransferase
MSSARATDLSEVDVVVLAGGLGTRLRPVLPDMPKVLAPINGRPYLDFLLDWLAGFGVGRVVLCLGYLAESVQAHLRDCARDDMAIAVVVEPKPAGTAGALRYAHALLRSDPVMVMNGDSFIDADLRAFLTGHLSAGAVASLLCAEVSDASRYGRIALDADGLVQRFAEKDPSTRGAGLINAGVYLFDRPIVEEIVKSDAVSLERDVFPDLATRGIRSHATDGAFIDIGTPESLAAAPDILSPYQLEGGR